MVTGSRHATHAISGDGFSSDEPARIGSCEPGGVCKLLDAAAIARSSGVAEQARQQAFDILVNGLGLSVTVRAEPGKSRAIASLAAACEVLAQAAADAGAAPERVEILIDHPSVNPAEAAGVRGDKMGAGFVHMVAGEGRLRGPGGCAPARGGFWHELWRGSPGARLQVAYAAPVRASSSLLRSEPATAILPRAHIEVPAGSAWVQLRVDLASFCSGGALCMASLEQALRRCVSRGEQLHDSTTWLTPAMRDDAWLNRRLAIAVHGIGDLVVAAGLDPSAFSTLEFLDRVMRGVQKAVRDQSRILARQTAHVPALERTDPCRFLPSGSVRDAWHQRWTEMLATAGVRHRNLLAMSPWGVFPAGEPADFRYADLLPVLRYADACMLSGAPDLGRWTVNQFREFHCRASAALQQRESRHQIAEGC